ncbi:hypothetical protein [Streptomyces sp. NPDC052127]|uniref:hypothetical protein n=1 Tax=unclassified Streptomyces TaxID=2593676 RepID=UPI0034239294|nr:hypothetical protein OG760_07640 [Streptomyces sp. NBC_00963]
MFDALTEGSVIMEVTCIKEHVDGKSEISMEYNYGGAPEVTAGLSYPVAGMSIYAGVVMVLIRDDAQLPGWYPMEMFDVRDPRMPSHWLFAKYPGSEYLQALWGYEELINDEFHYDALLERDNGALVIFSNRLRGSGVADA